ncbi:MAG: bifunctional nuclease family protein [Spirochaetaceae bacterium]|nr:bifunctional nuclease family protein [Spirochaetaceae bacterium]
MKAEIWGIAEAGEGYTVFIKPLESEQTVPIFIGLPEAQAILAGFEETARPRPLTADLFLRLAQKAECTLIRVEISELTGDTFFSRMVFSGPRGEFVLDARPSDALALAVRCKCPLDIAEKVVAEAGIPADTLDEATEPGRELRKEILRSELDQAVTEENYEKAAEIRDILNLLDKDIPIA